MDQSLLTFLVDVGANGFLIYLVMRLLTRQDSITDKIIALVEQDIAENAVIANKLGISVGDYRAQTDMIVREKVRQRLIDNALDKNVNKDSFSKN